MEDETCNCALLTIIMRVDSSGSLHMVFILSFIQGKAKRTQGHTAEILENYFFGNATLKISKMFTVMFNNMF